MRRPDVFTLDYGHPLAQGLVLAGLAGLQPGFIDSSKLSNHSISGDVTKKFDEESGRYRYIVPGSSVASMTLANASDDYRLQSNTPIACAFWARFPYTSTASVDGFLKHGVWNSGDGGNAGWWMCYEREIATYYRRRVRFGSYLRNFSQLGYFTENTLHHYYIESSASGWKIYTDGYLNNSGTSGSHPNSTLSYAPVLFNCGVSSELSDILLFRRALSPAEIAILADRTDHMLGGLIVEERPVMYFDMGGSTTDALTASDLVTGSPVLGTTAIGQVHALTAMGITTSAPAIGSPAVGQVHSLTASAPVVGSPVIGTPSLTENAADVHALTADDLVVGIPALGAPALGQIHVLGSDGLVTGSPVLGSPSITQIHTLEALGLTVGVPVLGAPALNGSDIVLITAAEVARIVRATSRMKTVTASARVKQVRYEVTRA